MVSEDSQKAGGLLTIHGLGNLSNLDDTVHGQVRALINQGKHVDKLLEIFLFGSLQRLSREEGHNLFSQIVCIPNTVAQKIFAVIINPTVDEDVTTLEKVFQDL